ncbi:MAG: adenylate kinase family protein, partial [Gemmataceae bacterium]
ALYHMSVKPPGTPGVCDKCGSPLLTRDDDREETIRQRLREYHANTDALIDHYRHCGLVREVSALDHPETIYQNIARQLHGGASQNPANRTGRMP